MIKFRIEKFRFAFYLKCNLFICQLSFVACRYCAVRGGWVIMEATVGLPTFNLPLITRKQEMHTKFWF